MSLLNDILQDLLGVFLLRPRSIESLARRREVGWSVGLFCIGFVAFVLIRNSTYGVEVNPLEREQGFWSGFYQLNLIQTLLFFTAAYIPVLAGLCNALSGDGLGFSFTREEYRRYISALLPVWGGLFLVSAPLQWGVPQFVEFGPVGVSFGSLMLILLFVFYTIWIVKELSYIPVTAAIAAFGLAFFTLPIFGFLMAFVFSLPLFFMIPVIIILYRRFQEYLPFGSKEADLRRHLQSLTTNPQDADAHYQLGLIHLQRGNFVAAKRYFGSAQEIDPQDPDYHYSMGKAYEAEQDWENALEQYEETYRINPEYGLGDIFREVGKGYLHAGERQKAMEFLNHFLQGRSSDPEGRYWLALAYRREGNVEEMIRQLELIVTEARKNPRFFRKENRKWLYQARVLLRQSSN